MTNENQKSEAPTRDVQSGLAPAGLLDGWVGFFDEGDKARADRISKEMMDDIKELEQSLLQFHVCRNQWAEIVANNWNPGRDSEYAKRLRLMQGSILRDIDGHAWRLRMRIRDEKPSNAVREPSRTHDTQQPET